jgi:uncharacterized membrane protein YvbJ
LKQPPRFFCDNCGYEVGHEVKSCPFCGRFFASVRCPSCGFAGEEKMFLNGCPMCGYSAGASAAKNKSKKKKKSPPQKQNAEPLPAWMYIISVIVLIAAVAILSWFITR